MSNTVDNYPYLRVTKSDDDVVFINVEKIVAIRRTGDTTTVVLPNIAITIKELPEQFMEMIRSITPIPY